MPVDVDHVGKVIAQAAGCASGMIEVSLVSLEFGAVQMAVSEGHLDWVANGVACISASGRAFVGGLASADKKVPA